MPSPLFYLIPFIYLFTFHTRLAPSRMHIHIRIYKFSTRHKAAKFEKILIEFFEKICLHFWILWQTFCCVIISKFEIASRAGTAASNHFIGASAIMMISPRSNIIMIIRVCVCLSLALRFLFGDGRLPSAILEEVHTEIKNNNGRDRWMDRWMGESWDRRP